MSGARVLPLSRREYIWVEGNALTEPVCSYRALCVTKWREFEAWCEAYEEAQARERRLNPTVTHFGRGVLPRPLPARPLALPAGTLLVRLWTALWLGALLIGGRA